MLQQIYIENFALIDKLELDIESGFTVFTGETGSGKSIMIDAISFAIGKRADKTFVRKNSKKATIELTFFIQDNMRVILEKLLKEEDIEIEENIIFLKREIYADGRSLCKINSKNVSMLFLKKISSYLINIHGQNEFNELEDSNHINILDSFAGIRKSDDYKEYQRTYKKYVTIRKEYQGLYSNYDKEKNEKELELLNYQINEITEMKLKPDEDKRIEEALELIENAERIAKSIDGLYEELYGKSNNILRILKKYVDEFEDFAYLDDTLSDIGEKLTEQYYTLEELAYQVRDNTNRYSYDEYNRIALEDRYNEILRIYSKYGDSYEKVQDFLMSVKKEVEFYSQYEDKIISIKKDITQLDSELKIMAKKITDIRINKKVELEKLIGEELETLGMKSVSFAININELEKYTARGRDEVVFLISFNKGEEAKSFSKVASGGEISRFMLALKNVINSEYEKTIIFDEIDTGISGLASEKVGRKMKDISKTRQVICITHQGQIASYAQNHVEVYKEEDDENTLTRIKVLNEKERIQEIAKMMDASTDSIKALEHAKELLKKNSK